MDPEHADSGSLGWYRQIYDSNYMEYATCPGLGGFEPLSVFACRFGSMLRSSP